MPIKTTPPTTEATMMIVELSLEGYASTQLKESEDNTLLSPH